MSLKKALPKLINTGNLELRQYQIELYEKSLDGNSLIVLPTGLGKTTIAALIIARILEEHDGSKVLVMAPSKPLVDQLTKSFQSTIRLQRDLIVGFTGEDPPDIRLGSWKVSRVIVSTPHVIRNDVLAARYSLKEVSLLIVDEAHKAVGDYPYVYLAKKYLEQNPSGRIVGLTASPGYSEQSIETLQRNLYLKNIYYKDRSDPLVNKYVREVREETVLIEPPMQFASVLKYLNILLDKFLRPLRDLSLITYKNRIIPLKKLIELQKELVQRAAKEGWKDDSSNKLIMITNSVRVSHLIGILETQGVNPALLYVQRVEESARRRMSKALKILITDPFWITARVQLDVLSQAGFEHPKLLKLQELLVQHFESGGKRAIVFTNYRDTASLIVKVLRERSCLRPIRFVGKASKPGDKGLKQTEQASLLERFRANEFNVLVATQVAEEGLDISECDLVVMYDNVPSPLRLIQRIGRTGRMNSGRVVYLVTKNSRDEIYYYISKKRRKSVIKAISEGLKNNVVADANKITRNVKYGDLTIIVDTRETNSSAVAHLSGLGVGLRVQQLSIADYIVSDEVCVERKTVEDFTQSIFDGRLFEQALNMRRSYRKPILIVEGENIYSAGLNPESIRGALVSLAVDYGIPILWSRSPQDTALLLIRIAVREQRESGSKPIIRGSRKPVANREIQEYIVASLPGVDSARAKILLRHFKSVQNVFTATLEELEAVEGIGRKTAEKIRHIIEEEYRVAGADEDQ